MVYTELEVWKEVRALVKLMYLHFSSFPRDEMFGLQSQMKRAVSSIPSNIAEGCGRNHRKDSLQFFFISGGSAFELETQLYLAFDLGFINQTIFDEILSQIEKVKKLLSGFIKYFEGLANNKN
jgi:four helix bundle protein